MAPRQIIEDSDDEGDGDASPDGSPEKADTVVETCTSMIQTSSTTDPVLFQAVYEQHLGIREIQANVIRDNEQLPIFEDFIYDQRMSSFETSVRKLKSSKTINNLSLTSISELNDSNQKAKSVPSTKDMEDLTQVTTPVESKGVVRRDIWEFPSSGTSEQVVESSTKVRSRNVSANSVKTYGRPMQRSHTMAYGASSPPSDCNPQHKISKRALEDENEEVLPPMPKSKKHKRDRSMNNDMLDESGEPSINSVQIGLVSTTKDTISTSSGVATINVPRSTSQVSRVGNLVDVTTQVSTETVSALQYADPLTTSSVFPISEKFMTPIVIIPNILTETEKLQYDIVSVPSTAQSGRLSLPDMMDIVDLNLKFTGESSTIPNDTPLQKISSGIVPTPGSVVLLSSSPPVSAANRRIKRAKSEVAFRGPLSSDVLTSSGKTKKRRERSKTMAPGEEPPNREASVDELSLTPMTTVDATPTKKGTMKKRAQVDEEGENSIVNKAPSSDEIQAELYKPRPSLRRSKSMFIESSNITESAGVGKHTSSRTKSKKFSKHRSLSVAAEATLVKEENVANERDQKDEVVTTPDIGQIEGRGRSDRSQNVIRLDPAAETPANPTKPLTLPSFPAQPKRRGRKKTAEIIPNNLIDNPDAQLQETMSSACKISEAEPTMLLEADSNRLPSQEPTHAPSPREHLEQPLKKTPPKSKTVSTPQLAQTPSKDPRKVSDQHSPLQSGKVPYRVGLSKRTRIAPLLKIIRK